MVVTLITLWSPSITFAQGAGQGSIDYLKYCNGINNIILGSDVQNLGVSKLSYLDGDSRIDADSCFKYEYKDERLLAMGDSLNLDLIGIRTYKDKVINIYLFFKMNDAYKVLNNFINAYGQFTDRPDNYTDIYNWNSSMVNLTLRYQYKADLGIAIFTSKQLEDEMMANKLRVTAKDDYQALSLNTVDSQQQ